MSYKYGDIVTSRVTWSDVAEITSQLVFEFSHYELNIDLEPIGVYAVKGTVHKVIFPKGDSKAPIAFRQIEDFNYDSPFNVASCSMTTGRIRHFFERRKGI